MIGVDEAQFPSLETGSIGVDLDPPLGQFLRFLYLYSVFIDNV